MAKPPKIDRKAIRGPDEFQKQGRSFVEVFWDKRRLWLPVLGIVLVGAVSFYSYRWWNESRLEKAWEAYAEVSQQPVPERWKALEAFHGQHGNLRPTYMAAVTLAEHFFEERKKQVLDPKASDAKQENAATSGALAVEWYSKALNFSDLLPVERQLILVNRGKAYELDTRYDEALAEYQEAARIEGTARPLALLNLGRAWELKGDKEKAGENYEKVSVEFVGTEFARQAKAYRRAMLSPLLLDKTRKGKSN